MTLRTPNHSLARVLGQLRAGNRAPYLQRVLAIERASLIAYWPLNELSGSVAVNAQGVSARNGAYTAVTLNSVDGPGPTLGRAGLWNGSTSTCNVYSTSLNSAFTGAKFTVALWFKATNWADNANRYMCHFHVDGNNFVHLQKTVANGLQWTYTAGSVSKARTKTGTFTGWTHLAMTVDKAADEMKAYFNGVQDGATLTGLGTWAGSLLSTRCALGSFQTGTVTAAWDGNVHHCAVWADRALSAAQIQQLAMAN